MNKNLNKGILVIIILCCIISAFVACNTKEYKLEFIVDGEVYKTIHTNGRELIELPTPPQKDKFDFDGWYWDEGSWEDAFQTNDLLYKPLSSNAKLYAKWKEKEPLQGTQAEFDGFDKTEEFAYSVTVDSNIMSFSFNNIVKVNSKSTWVVSKDLNGEEIISNKGVKLEEGENIFYVIVTAEDNSSQAYKIIIHKKEALYNVVFESDGEEIKSLYVHKGEFIEEPDTVDKKGYTFLGWDFDFSRPIENSVIIRAIFEANNYTITFDGNGGELAEDTMQVVYDSQVVLPIPSKLGYEFKGWYRDDVLIENGVWNIDDNIELKAKWQLEEYTIEYNLNRGFNNQYNPSTYTMQSEDIILQNPTRNGCVFEGWYSDSMFKNKVQTIASGSIGNVELWAKWRAIEYTIKYNLNGGINNDKNPDIYTVNNNITLGEPVKLGYTFLGWSGSGLDEITKTVVIPYDSYGNKSYTANWQVAPEMSNFKFYSSNNKCSITGVNDINVTSVVIPDYVTEIQDEAFMDCTKLQTVTFAQNSKCTQIMSNAFYGCSSLQSIELPESLEFIDQNSFRACENLKDVYFAGNLADWCNINFYNYYSNPAYFEGNLYIDGKLLQGDVVIPYGVTKINNNAFVNRVGLNSLTIPDSVTSIGTYAFYGCTSLTDIIIPDSVTNIGEYAFYRCSGLTDITMSDSVTSIGECAFYRCSSLTDITIPDGVTSIGKYAFYNCTSLREAIIPQGVVSIENGLFENCSSLESVIIPDSITSIGQSAFSDCVSLSSITIPAQVISIGNDALYNCSSLQSIEVKAGNTVYHSSGNCLIETASKTLLYGCQNSVIPDDGSVTEINARAFYNCAQLKSIVIPDSVTNIGVGAFEECVGLENVVLSQNLMSIQTDSFWNCTSLQSIDIPDSVTIIGSNAFNGCGALTNLTIGNGVTIIGEKAFYDCYALASVIIGKSVNSIEGYAFSDCNSLTAVHYEGDILAWCNIAFANSDANPVSYAQNLYIGGELLQTLQIPQTVESIGDYTFYNCQSITSVTIPSSLKSIGQYAFMDCNIVDVYYQGDIEGWCGMNYENVYANPMYFAKNLYIDGNLLQGKLVIPDSVASIAAAAFANTSITDIIIPDSLTTIGEKAFYNCNNIVSIKVPDTVEQIQNGAFANCKKLTIFAESTSKPAGWHNNWSQGVSVVWDCNNSNLGNDGYRYITYEGVNYALKDNDAKVVGNNVSGSVVIASEIEYDGKIYKVDYVDAWAFSNCNDITSVIFPKGPITIASGAFDNCNSLAFVFICGSPTDFSLFISNDGNEVLTDTSRYYYYSETQPAKEGNYWHYVDGTPTVW